MLIRSLLILLFLGSFAMSAEKKGPIYVQSPEFHDNGRVTLRYFAPQAKEVRVASNVKEIAQPMQRNEQGVWELTFGPLSPNTYAYKYLVDGAVVIDPVNRNIKGWLWLANQLEVPGKEPAAHQLQAVPHGQVQQRWYESPLTSQTRRMFVYLPPGYNKAAEKYPVLYLFHGSGDDESTWSQVGQVQHLADNLLAAGKAKPMVIVMPFGHDQLPTDPDFDNYDCLTNFDYVVKEFFAGVVPFVESEYHLREDVKGKGLAGNSLGGGQALRIGLTHTDQFHYVAGLSPAVEKHALMELLPEELPPIKAKKPWIWLGCGKRDFLFEDTVKLDQWFNEQEVEHSTYIDEGNHNWHTWRGYLTQILPKLFRE